MRVFPLDARFHFPSFKKNHQGLKRFVQSEGGTLNEASIFYTDLFFLQEVNLKKCDGHQRMTVTLFLRN
jgi:hypothetical protein